MARLLLGNLDPEATDDDIREFLDKYGFPPCDSIEHEPGAGSRPAVVVVYAGIDTTALDKFQGRIHDMFWRKRKLSARLMQDRFA